MCRAYSNLCAVLYHVLQALSCSRTSRNPEHGPSSTTPDREHCPRNLRTVDSAEGSCARFNEVAARAAAAADLTLTKTKLWKHHRVCGQAADEEDGLSRNSTILGPMTDLRILSAAAMSKIVSELGEATNAARLSSSRQNIPARHSFAIASALMKSSTSS